MKQYIRDGWLLLLCSREQGAQIGHRRVVKSSSGSLGECALHGVMPSVGGEQTIGGTETANRCFQ